jgi:hypothetical protein
MAEKGYRFITTIPLFTGLSLSAGSSGTSGAIDLREIAQEGKFSVSASVAIGTAGTCGTTTLEYTGCSTKDGTYVAPAVAGVAGTIGTAGTAAIHGTSNIFGFTPVAALPFMKVVATQVGAGNVGYDSVLTATLNVQ